MVTRVMAGLIIAPKARIFHGHDWVYGTEVRTVFGNPQPGDVVLLKDQRDHYLGSAITLYELSVLKTHIFPLLTAVQPEDPSYDEVRAIVKVLNFVQEAMVDDEIPPTSLVREFIGGNSYYK